MACLVIGEVNMAREVYEGMIGQLAPRIQGSPGFVLHAGGDSGGGKWRVIEVWESQADAESWFENNVRPNLPDGVTPNREYHDLHTVVTKEKVDSSSG